MSRKRAVLVTAFVAVTSILWADSVSAQVQIQKVGRPWEVDGAAIPYLDDGVASDRGEGVIEDDGHLKSWDMVGPGTDTPARSFTPPRMADGSTTQSSTFWIFRWWLSVVRKFHL